MYILNSSGFVVQVQEATPVVPAGSWSTPSWARGALTDIQVSPALAQAVFNGTGTGPLTLDGKVVGIRGTILVTFVTGAQGAARTVGYLTDNTSTPTKRIVIGVDGLNRPTLSIRNYAGTVVASVNPSYASIPAGTQVQALLSWDSTQAIDSTRFAVFQVNRGAVPNGDWAVNPTTSWTSFQPTFAVLGYGVGLDSDFNGQVIAFQVSNTTSTGGTGADGQSVDTHTFDLFGNDTIVTLDSVVVLKT